MTPAPDPLALLVARILGALSRPEVSLRLHVAGRPELVGAVLTDADVLTLVDELELPLSRRRACAALVESGLAEASEGGVRILAALPEDVLRWLPAEQRPEEVPLEAIAERVAALEGRAGTPASVAPEVLVVADAIARSAAWVAEIVQISASRSLVGLPVFWIPMDAGYRPESNDVGSIATLDGLLMALNGLEVSPHANPNVTAAAGQLAAMLMAMQRQSDDWSDGALVTPMWDDDFPGTFMPATAELGPCPTLDATACLATGLGRVLSSPMAPSAPPGAVAALERAAACVLRWQSPEGAWAILRYENDGWTLPARTLSTVYAADALRQAADHTMLDVAPAARRAVEFLRRTAKSADGHVWWEADFDAAATKHRLGATALIVPALVSFGRLSGEDVEALIAGAVDHLRANWVLEPDAALVFRFRVPTWRGPALDVFAWELPLQPIVVSALLATPDTAARLTTADRRTLGAAVASILAGCHPGGFWVDLLKEAEGKTQGMTGNSDFFQTALLDYLRDQSRAARALNL